MGLKDRLNKLVESQVILKWELHQVLDYGSFSELDAGNEPEPFGAEKLTLYFLSGDILDVYSGTNGLENSFLC